MSDLTLTANFASAIKNSEIRNQASVAVAKKTLDAQKQQGDAAVALISQAAQISDQLSKGQLDVQL